MTVETDVTKESVAVFLEASEGEHLLYRVTVKGVSPIFTLVDTQVNRLLLSHKDAPVSTDPVVFERRWPLPTDQTLQVSSHTLGLQFLGAPITYRYEVQQIRANGASVSIIDITYSSNIPTDFFFQALQVTTV